MAYDINADSYPDYDEWGPDNYWSLTDWQTFYDKLIQKYGADEGSRRWLDAWWRQSTGASPVNNENSIMDWAKSKGLWKGSTLFSSGFFKPSEFVPPLIPNQGQVNTNIDPVTGLPKTEVVGSQQDARDAQKKNEEKQAKVNKGLLIGGGVLLLGLTITYFVLKAKNKVQ
jgi:hypothetical protein